MRTHEECVGQWIGPCAECGWTTAWYDGALLVHLDKPDGAEGTPNPCSVLAWYREHVPPEPVVLPEQTVAPAPDMVQCHWCHQFWKTEAQAWVCPHCRMFNLDRSRKDRRVWNG